MKSQVVLLLMLLQFVDAAAAQNIPRSGYLQRDQARREVIVFVHGVLGDAKGTWTNETSKTYWPAMVREDETFKAANVWTFSYFTDKVKVAQDVSEVATKLGDEIRAQDVFRAHDRVYFVAHSMGGLITRELLVQQQPPPQKVPLIYFFGTPSAGAHLAGVAAAVSSNPQFENMRPFTREADVSSYARRWLATAENVNARYPQRIWSFCAYEIQPFALGQVIVHEASASFLCSTSPRASLANHITMVKPADKAAEPYQYLVSAYKFVRSPQAMLVAVSEAITLHSPQTPGIRIENLELQTARVTSEAITVGCNEVASGQRNIKIDLAPGKRILAVKPEAQAAGPLPPVVSATFDPKGRISVGYRVAGGPAHPYLGCPAVARAQINVQYVIEKQ